MELTVMKKRRVDKSPLSVGRNYSASARGKIEQEAAEWVAFLEERPLESSEMERFREWLAADAFHKEVFHDFDHVWRLLDTLRNIPVRNRDSSISPRIYHNFRR